jgi:hypothetical protein
VTAKNVQSNRQEDELRVDKRSESLDAARIDLHEASAMRLGSLVTESGQSFADAQA